MILMAPEYVEIQRSFFVMHLDLRGKPFFECFHLFSVHRKEGVDGIESTLKSMEKCMKSNVVATMTEYLFNVLVGMIAAQHATEKSS